MSSRGARRLRFRIVYLHRAKSVSRKTQTSGLKAGPIWACHDPWLGGHETKKCKRYAVTVISPNGLVEKGFPTTCSILDWATICARFPTWSIVVDSPWIQ